MSTLPAELTSFIGRANELTETKGLLAGGRLVTLLGAAGVGKTRLAVRVADQLRRVFPDGVYLVELVSLDRPDLVARTVAMALGLHNADTQPGGELYSFLKAKRMLLVLDNCEHVADAAAQVVTMVLAAAPRVRVLATSRHVLGLVGEQVLQVEPLPVPEVEGQDRALRLDVVGLFADRAATASPGFRVDGANWSKVIQLCRRLDGIPLAIELAAAWLRMLTLDDVLERLDDRFSFLTRGSRIAHHRQRTLRSAVEWSSDLCSPTERLLWARLSVFMGGFDLDAVEEVCSGQGIDRADVLYLLAGLVDKSILYQAESGETVRFGMLETIRQFGRDGLRESREEPGLRIRHRDYFLVFAERAEQDWLRGTPQVEVAVRTRAERANLWAALEFCLGTPGQEEVGLRLAVTLQYFWQCCGFLAEGRSWMQRALALNPAPSRVRARALWLAAWAPTDAAGARAGLPYALEAEQWAHEHGDKSMLAYAKLVLAGCALYAGEMDRAAELFAEADGQFKDLGETNTVVLVASGMVALVAAFRDSADVAVSIAQDALARCEATGEQWATARVLWALACGQWQRGEPTAALNTVSRSLRISQSLKDGFGAALVLEVFAWASATVGETTRAAEMLGMIHQTWPRVGKPLGMPALTAEHDECVRNVREALGSKEYDLAFRRGRANAATVDDVVAYALGSARAAPAGVAREVDPNGLLTKRERQVAGLVADGLSNRDIAEQLVISPRTAETHVNRVLGKLGFTSRTQFAARMAEGDGSS